MKAARLPDVTAANDALAAFEQRIATLERRLRRERSARLEAETIAESGFRQLHESHRRTELLQRIASAANEATTVREAFGFALEMLCLHCDWAFGNVLLVDEADPTLLRPANIWFAPRPRDLGPFIDVSLARSFVRGEGLPGRVLEHGEPVWLKHEADAQSMPRGAVGLRCGIRTGIALPVIVGWDIGAVIEFFAHDWLEEDGELLALLGQVGIQIGRVFERERFAAKLMHDALHDPLTGLPNRTLLAERLDRATERCRFQPDEHVALMFIDLDGFKFVNDHQGHATGDALLKAIARQLETVVERQRDAVAAAGGIPPQCTIARMSGDEFTILLEQCGDPLMALRVGEAVLNAIPTAYPRAQVTASIGVAHGSGPALSDKELLRNADTAMYAAKAAGRAQLVVFDAALSARTSARAELETALSAAVQAHAFALRYQPIVRIADNRLAGFEALLRWERTPGDFVTPDTFIEIAEDSGMIVLIGEWVLREACSQMVRWHREHPSRRDLKISINVSPRQFMQTGFVEMVGAVIAESGIDPARVVLEVTERIAISNPDRAVEVMDAIAAMGVKISLDDFGTGYSSLGHLHRYPFDTLKLDRSFVADLCTKGSAPGIVRAVLDLAATMKLDVVAEGIETQEQLMRLRALGCDFAQGYYYARPLEPDAAERLIANQA